MAVYVDFEELKSRDEPFFLVFREKEELVMEPRCSCGEVLEESFVCIKCGKACDISCFVCKTADVASVAEKLIRGNPEFRHFKLYLLRGGL